MITQDRLRELLSYDPETGVFTRIVGRPGPNARAGDIAGCDNGQGYIRIYVDGKPYKAHRLAWLYKHGEFPQEIDHIDCDRSNNRIANLRPVTRGQNRTNCGAYKSNTSGFKGVSFNRRSQKWIAQIQKGGRKIGLGYFATPEEASARYASAVNEFHGEYGRVA